MSKQDLPTCYFFQTGSDADAELIGPFTDIVEASKVARATLGCGPRDEYSPRPALYSTTYETLPDGRIILGGKLIHDGDWGWSTIITGGGTLALLAHSDFIGPIS